MLIIQEICLIWHKEERGGTAAAARARFPQAYNWPSECGLHNVLLHKVDFFQHGGEFCDLAAETKRNLAQALPAMGFERAEIERRISQRLWQAQKYEKQFYNSAADLNLTNLALEYCGDNLEVTFVYDERRGGRPARRGRNKDYQNRGSRLYGRDCLNETAFLLAPGEYGRVVWNERDVNGDSGGWYYQLHIYNILCWLRGIPPADVLRSRPPDFLYEQLADLY